MSCCQLLPTVSVVTLQTIVRNLRKKRKNHLGCKKFTWTYSTLNYYLFTLKLTVRRKTFRDYRIFLNENDSWTIFWHIKFISKLIDQLWSKHFTFFSRRLLIYIIIYAENIKIEIFGSCNFFKVFNEKIFAFLRVDLYQLTGEKFPFYGYYNSST